MPGIGFDGRASRDARTWYFYKKHQKDSNYKGESVKAELDPKNSISPLISSRQRIKKTGYENTFDFDANTR